MRVLVIGLARAGSSMADALARKGAKVTVVDQKPADDLALIHSMDRLRGQGVEVITSWSGDVVWNAFDVIAPSPGVHASHPALREAKKRGTPVWSEIEVAHRISKAPIVAITGTNGKSTVTALTHHILSSSGKKSILCGNIAGSGLPEKTINAAALASSSDDILVAEVSSFQLEWIDRFRPHACTITNISQDHLDRYRSLDEYAAAKKRIYENQTDENWAVINLDRPETYDYPIVAKQLTYGEQGQDIVTEAGSMSAKGERISANELWSGGRHNLQNASAASLLASPFSVSMQQAFSAIRTFRGLANRMEIIGEADGRRFVNNSMCTNPEALLASLAACTQPVVLLAGGVNKVHDLSALSEIGNLGVRAAILFGRDATQLEKAIGNIQTRIVGDLPQAFAQALTISKAGDTILLSPGCASFDQFEDFIARGDCFRSIVRDFIGNAKYESV